MSQSRHLQTELLPQSELARKLGIEAVEVGPAVTVLRMPVEGNRQVAGVLHGGATAALCENAASWAALAHIEDTATNSVRRIALGTEVSISHLRPATSGFVTAKAEAVHLGRTTTVHSVSVVDDQGRLVSTALVRNMLVDAR